MLSNHKLENYEVPYYSMIIMKLGTVYVIFDAVCILVFVIFFLLSLYYDVTSGVIFFFISIIGSIVSFFERRARKIIVENNTIIENKMWRKRKEIKFAEVDHLTLTSGNNTEIICVYSKTGVTIKIPKYFQNVDMFETVILNHRWKYK